MLYNLSVPHIFNTILIECGKILQILSGVSIEILIPRRAAEDQNALTVSHIKALGGWEVLEEFEGRLKVTVPSGWDEMSC
ncbi:hypothetical protein DL93DRAFT_2087941 [Clavulina sp. PMI_390]|nr:hypothetical protein DL93DRAFT_2087941 [Clavulina sp. PMI_390]